MYTIMKVGEWVPDQLRPAYCYAEEQWLPAVASEGGVSCPDSVDISHHMQSMQVTRLHYGPEYRREDFDLWLQWVTMRKTSCVGCGGIDQRVAS